MLKISVKKMNGYNIAKCIECNKIKRVCCDSGFELIMKTVIDPKCFNCCNECNNGLTHFYNIKNYLYQREYKEEL